MAGLTALKVKCWSAAQWGPNRTSNVNSRKLRNFEKEKKKQTKTKHVFVIAARAGRPLELPLLLLLLRVFGSI